MAASYGAAGRLAAAFVHSKLTPLFIVASMALGALAVVALPREEEPQIVVPMVDVFVEMPGATPADVEQRVTRPMEQLLWEVPGVEYVYSTSSAGQSMVVVRFTVGEAEEGALVRLNQKLAANADRIPPGVVGPIVKPRSIDDVPILAVTVWSARYGDDQLRALAAQLRDAIAEVTDVSSTLPQPAKRVWGRVRLGARPSNRCDGHEVLVLRALDVRAGDGIVARDRGMAAFEIHEASGEAAFRLIRKVGTASECCASCRPATGSVSDCLSRGSG